MFISRECDYAIRTVRALSSGELISVGDICESEHIPVQFAYKIMRKLKKAGLVESQQGTDGGYRLLRKPIEITLFDVVLAVDDEIALNECMRQSSTCPLNSNDKPCVVHGELCRIQAVLVKALSEKSVAELM